MESPPRLASPLQAVLYFFPTLINSLIIMILYEILVVDASAFFIPIESCQRECKDQRTDGETETGKRKRGWYLRFCYEFDNNFIPTMCILYLRVFP